MMPGELVREHLDWSTLPKQRKQHSLLAKSFAFVGMLYVAQLLTSPVFWNDAGDMIGHALIDIGTYLAG